MISYQNLYPKGQEPEPGRRPWEVSPATPEPEPGKDPNALLDLLYAPFRGVGKTIYSTGKLGYDLVDYITGDDLLPDSDNYKPEWLESKTAAGQIVSGIAEFGAGFIPVFGWLGRLEKAGKFLGMAGKVGGLARSMLAGAATDFVAFTGQEKRLSNLIQQYPSLQNPVTEFLAADPDDGAAEGRLKNALEGIVTGAASDLFLGSLKAYSRIAKARELGLKPEEVKFPEKELLAKKLYEVQQSLAKLKQTPKAELTGSKEITDTARRLVENGHLYQDPKEGGLIDLMDAPEAQKDLLKATAAEIRAKDLRERGTSKPYQSWDELDRNTRIMMEEGWGTTFDEIVARSRNSLQNAEEAIYHARAVAVTSQALSEEAVRLAKEAVETQNPTTIAKSLAAQEQLAELISISSGFGTVQGRALNARKMIRKAEWESASVARQIVQQLGGTGYLNPALERLVMAGAAGAPKLVRNQITRGGRLLRAHNELWLNAILSGPHTHVVNMVSNFANTLFLPAEGLVGGAMRGDLAAVRAWGHHYLSAMHAIRDSARFAWRAFKSESNQLLEDSAVSDVVERRAISAAGQQAGGVLGQFLDYMGHLVRLPSRFLITSDELFKQINYRAGAATQLRYEALKQGLRGEAADTYVRNGMEALIDQSGKAYSEKAIIAEGIRLADEKGLKGAERTRFVDEYKRTRWDPNDGVLSKLSEATEFGQGLAKEATYTQDLGKFGRNLQNLVRHTPALQLVLPFVKTPTNLIKFIGQRTFAVTRLPKDLRFPLLERLHVRHAEDLAAGGLRASQAMGRTATGLTAFYTVAVAASEGWLTGSGPSNKEERENLMATGWRPYSIRIPTEEGDVYISYQRFDPFSTFAGLAADWMEISKRQEGHLEDGLQATMITAASAFAQNITNKTYLAGLSQVLEALSEPARFMPRLTRARAASYVPNLLAQARAAAGDDYIREARSFFDAWQSRIPGLSEGLAPRRNILGEPVSAPRSAGEGAFRWTDWVNPIVSSKSTQDTVMEELARLQHGFSKIEPVLLGTLNLLDYVNGKGQSAHDRWQELVGEVSPRGKTVRQVLSKLIASKDYQSLPEESPELAELGTYSPRINAISRILSAYRRAAFAQLLKEYPELQQDYLALKRARVGARSGSRTAQEVQQLLSATN